MTARDDRPDVPSRLVTGRDDGPGAPGAGAAARVAILMGTANGGRYLRTQLASIAAQTHDRWTLVASDDGSTDDTIDILREFAEQHPGRVEIRPGPRQGFAANFLTLACDTGIDADFFAFCDQDDVWMPTRLARSVQCLQRGPADVPALYCSRTRYISEEGAPIGMSPLFRLQPSFRNALVQSLGGGNTMTFNRAARDVVAREGVLRVVAHDWWLYQLITGCGGEVYYDPEPSVEYRQHGGNLIGSNAGWRARWWRGRELVRGRFRRWNDVNLAALHRVSDRLLPENRRVLESFGRSRHSSLVERVRGLGSSGVYRQTPIGNVGLWAGAVLKRI